MPCPVLVQPRETGQPKIISILRPQSGFRQVAIHSKRSHRENAQSHLPGMIVSNVVLQMVVETLIDLVAEKVYAVEQCFPGRVIQQVIQPVIHRGQYGKESREIEVAHHILAVLPGYDFLHPLDGFIGIAAVFGQQIRAYQNVHIHFFTVDDSTALARHHGAALRLVLQAFGQLCIDVVDRLHRCFQYFLGTDDVFLPFRAVLTPVHYVAPLLFIQIHTWMDSGKFGDEFLVRGRAELVGLVFHCQLLHRGPIGFPVHHVSELPVPYTRSEVAVRVVERPAGLYRNHPLLERRVLRISELITQVFLAYLFLFEAFAFFFGVKHL